jgi:phage terminase large subunit GpA-like protein
MNCPLDPLVFRARRSLRPPQRLPLSTWAEQNIRLPEGASALPGRLRLIPYQRGIADAISDPAIERITLMKPVRVGFTMLLSATVAHFVANDPAPILLLQPTEADARDYVVSDLEPVFEATPALRGLLADDVSGDRNTMLSRRFAGGSLKVVAAKAPRNLRRHTARVLLVDEADAMLPGAEGSPLVLAERRTLSYADRKIVIGSTPLDADTSNVLRAYAASDMRIYEVPCPACGAFQEILWKHIEWPEGRPEDAAYRCPHCAELVEERHKGEMVAAGRWRATAPHVRGHAGFKINALVSPLANAAWGKLATEFIAAKDDTDNLRVFVNTILAEPWADAAEEIDEIDLAGRGEPFSLDQIPEEVLYLTAGVDVQDDRLECTIIGWSRENVAFVLAHHVLWGSPDDDLTWRDLDQLLRTRWPHPLGGTLGVDAAIVDSGDMPDRVYSFCFPRLSRRIWAGKGVGGQRPAFQMSKSKVRGGRLFLVGVDTVKASLINRLARGRSVRFSDTLEPSFYEQLASERRVTRYTRGQPVRRFERKAGARAEALDAVVYAFAAFAGIAKLWDARENELRQVASAPARQSVVRSKWLERNSTL